MASTDHSAMAVPTFDAPPPSILIVAAPFYRKIADDLIAGARGVIKQAGAKHDLIEVPGALEIPTAIRLAGSRYEGFVALGCVIRGETSHYDTVCNDSSRGLTLLGLEGFCIGNGILTCENMQQASVRATPDEMDKGGGAANAALHLIALARRFASPAPGNRAVPAAQDDILLADSTGLTRTA